MGQPKFREMCISVATLGCVVAALYWYLHGSQVASTAQARGTETEPLLPRAMAAGSHLQWDKGLFVLPHALWVEMGAQFSLDPGGIYRLIQAIGDKEKCLFGHYRLKQVLDEGLVFFGRKPIKTSQLEIFAKFKGLKVTYFLLPFAEAPPLPFIESCAEWLMVENL